MIPNPNASCILTFLLLASFSFPCRNASYSDPVGNISAVCLSAGREGQPASACSARYPNRA